MCCYHAMRLDNICTWAAIYYLGSITTPNMHMQSQDFDNAGNHVRNVSGPWVLSDDSSTARELCPLVSALVTCGSYLQRSRQRFLE